MVHTDDGDGQQRIGSQFNYNIQQGIAARVQFVCEERRKGVQQNILSVISRAIRCYCALQCYSPVGRRRWIGRRGCFLLIGQPHRWPSSLFSSINYYLYRVGPVFRWLNNFVLCWCTFTTSSLVCWWWVLLFTVYLKTLSMDGRVHIHFYSRLIWGASGNKWFYTCLLVVRVLS